MKNINFDLSSLKDGLAKFSKNLSWLFLTILIVILLMEALEIKQSVQIVLSSNDEPVVASHQEGVRIDFKNYDKVISRIQQVQGYEVSSTTLPSPFGTR